MLEFERTQMYDANMIIKIILYWWSFFRSTSLVSCILITPNTTINVVAEDSFSLDFLLINYK